MVLPSTSNRGYGGGNNLGIRAAARDAHSAILLLNSDVEISEAAVCRLLARLEADPTLSVVGPLLVETSKTRTCCYAGGRDIARHPRTRIEVDARAFDRPSGLSADSQWITCRGRCSWPAAPCLRTSGCSTRTIFLAARSPISASERATRGHKLRVDLEVEARHAVDDGEHGCATPFMPTTACATALLYVRKASRCREAAYITFFGR